MAAAAKKKGKADLVAAMNARAAQILEELGKDTVSLETQLKGFAEVGRWIGISNRIADIDGDGVGLLDAYRTRINQAESEVAVREASRLKARNYDAGPGYQTGQRYLGRNQRAAKGGTTDNGGDKLEALKARLPRADDGGVDGDRGGGGGEIAVNVGPARIVRPELPGNTDTRFDEPYSSDEF